jgi:hypothetical protein
MKLKSFGCSFTYGSDLSDCSNFDCSLITWPALLAKNKQFEYECYAEPGIGNLQIMNSVLEQAQLNDPAVFVINWTWLDRFDYFHPVDETFLTLRPDGDQVEHQLYYRHFYNQYHTMLTNSAYVVAVISLLQSRGIDFFMTAQDTVLIEPVNPNWHDPRAIRLLQKTLKPYLNWFDGLSFLDWSRQQGYEISEALHPLDTAHQAAANYMLKVFDKRNIIVPIPQALS